MRLFFAAMTAVTMLFGSMQVAQAQASFLLGMLLGSAMSGDVVQGSEGNPNLVYVAPRVAERVKDPMDLRFVSVGFRNDNGLYGMTMRQLFARALPNPKEADKYEVVQIIRIASQGSAYDPYVWFTYIDRSLLIALEKLPPAPPKKG